MILIDKKLRKSVFSRKPIQEDPVFSQSTQTKLVSYKKFALC